MRKYRKDGNFSVTLKRFDKIFQRSHSSSLNSVTVSLGLVRAWKTYGYEWRHFSTHFHRLVSPNWIHYYTDYNIHLQPSSYADRVAKSTFSRSISGFSDFTANSLNGRFYQILRSFRFRWNVPTDKFWNFEFICVILYLIALEFLNLFTFLYWLKMAGNYNLFTLWGTFDFELSVLAPSRNF